MCGIFGWTGQNPDQFNKLKFDILGIYNDSRGGDSCGVTTDGEIYYGATNGVKHYKEFIVEKNYLNPNIFPVVIGHTRKSSIGIINENNAHPFGFGLNEEFDCYHFLGVHNGTLYNHESFAKNYNVETTVYKTENITKHFVRNKIDSEILLECIFKDKSFKVLNEYIGGAAILFTDTTESNVLYAFHGASPTYTNGKMEEERPLFFYKENKNSLYISSLAESLVAIGGIIDETIHEFKHNVVYKIKDGDIDSAELYHISRNNSLQRKPVYNNYYPNNEYYNDESYVDKYTSKSKKENEVLKKEKENIDNIYKDVINRVLPSPIVFHKLRYQRNGHLINGLYTFIKDYGIVPLDVEPRDLKRKLMDLIGSVFNKKTGIFTGSSVITDINTEDQIIPFPISKGNTPPVLYMYEGILLETEDDYNACKNMKFTNYEQLSYCAKHPIIDITYNFRSDEKIMLNGELYTGNFSPLSSNRIFFINNGKLVKIINIKNEINNNIDMDNTVIKLPINTANIMQQSDDNLLNNMLIERPIINFNEIEENKYNNEEDYDDELNQIDDMLTAIFSDVTDVNTQLAMFDNKEIVNDILNINQEYLSSLETISTKISK